MSIDNAPAVAHYFARRVHDMNARLFAMPETESIRVRLGPDLKPKWDGVLKARGISQQKAIESTIRWLVEQDALLQVMMFGQVPESSHGELARLVIAQLEVGSKRSRKIVRSKGK